MQKTIYISIEPGGIEPFVHVSQYDTGSRTLLFDFGPSYSIPAGASVSIRGTKPDKTGFAYPCAITSGKASVVVQDQMTVCAGRVPCEVRIEVDGTRIHSATFVLDVKPSALADDIKISETELPIVEGAQRAAFAAEESKNAALNSQNAASTSATQAASSAAAASGSASAASASATASKASEANAADSAKAAAQSASAAKTSAEAANRAFTGATSSADGSTGLVPKPTIADAGKYLCGDGTWKTVSGGTGTSDKPVEVEVELYDAVTSGTVTAYRIGHLLHICAENLSVKWKTESTIAYIFSLSNIGRFSFKSSNAMWAAISSTDFTLEDFGPAIAEPENDDASLLEVALVGKAGGSQTRLYFSMIVPLLDA